MTVWLQSLVSEIEGSLGISALAAFCVRLVLMCLTSVCTIAYQGLERGPTDLTQNAAKAEMPREPSISETSLSGALLGGF